MSQDLAGATGRAAVPTGNTYDKYHSANRIERNLVGRFMRQIDAMVAELHPERILEVGAGEGEVTHRLRARFPDAEIVTLDLPDPELAASWGRWHGVFGTAEALPFPDACFDLVMAIEVLEHTIDPQSAIRELARVGSATVVASVPREPMWRVLNMARGKYLRDLGNTPGHLQHWGRRSFETALSQVLVLDRTATPIPWTVARGTVRSHEIS